VIVYGHSEVVARWAGNRLGIADWGPCATIGIMRRGELVAAAVFHQYRHPNIEISFVTTDRRWGTPAAVRAIIRYPFIQLGCKRLTSTTEAGNQPSRAFLCRMGFREEGYHIDALPSGDAVTYGLLRKDAVRWLAEERPDTGQKFAESTASS
jgi:RimJ/RimL family protein N-acetyltransferase